MSQPFISREKLIGKQVIDLRASIIGTVKDISLGLGGERPEIALLVTSQLGEVNVRWDSIQAVGDVIILKEVFEKPTAPMPEPTAIPTPPTTVSPPTQRGLVCPSCGHSNSPGTRFCVRCGTKLTS